MMDLKKNPKTKIAVDFNNLNEKHLSIQLSLDGFSFCIINKIEKQVERIEHFSFKADLPPAPLKRLGHFPDIDFFAFMKADFPDLFHSAHKSASPIPAASRKDPLGTPVRARFEIFWNSSLMPSGFCNFGD